MYRMPEKRTWRWTVLNCGRTCFHQVSCANHLSFPSNWNILDFLWLFDLLRVLLHYFCESIILSCQFTLSKEKNFVETLHLVPQRYVSILLHLHLSANYRFKTAELDLSGIVCSFVVSEQSRCFTNFYLQIIGDTG